MGSDLAIKLFRAAPPKFQSTLPVWGATVCHYIIIVGKEFQSTLPVWGATLTYNVFPDGSKISIHAPRVGSDRR